MIHGPCIKQTMAPINEHMYTKISLHIHTVWFTLQSATKRILSYCEQPTDTAAYQYNPYIAFCCISAILKETVIT